MDDDIEDIVGDVKYTDSQKSITTRSSLAYSPDFTDCSSFSDKHNSTGKETYVIECDSEDSEKSEQVYPLHMCTSTINGYMSSSVGESTDGMTLMSAQCGPSQIITKCTSTSYHTMCSMIAHESYTQTSKTIIDIAEAEGKVKRVMDSNTLETQTSLVSITENKTVEYRIEVSNIHDHFTRSNVIGERSQTIVQMNENIFDSRNNTLLNDYYSSEPSPPQKPKYSKLTCNQFLHATLEDESSKCKLFETENDFIIEDVSRSDHENSSETSDDEVIRIINEDSNTDLTGNRSTDLTDNPTLHVASSDSEQSVLTDIEEDSLMEYKQVSSNDDVKELHEKLSENDDMCMGERFVEPDIWRFGTLTPLTEEANNKKESLHDMSVNRVNSNTNDTNTDQEEVLFRSAAGVNVKILKQDDIAKSSFKLPPIQNHSCPNSPHLSLLFGKPKLNKAGTLPSLCERHNLLDRWEITNKNLASGESALISERSVQEHPKKQSLTIQLPPIYGETLLTSKESFPSEPIPPISVQAKGPSNGHAISIGEKIKELKMSSRRSSSSLPKQSSYSRTGSPNVSPDNSRPGWHDARDIAERGCEAVCVDLLRRMRSNSWFEVIETLEELPKELNRFWGVITETRIADLLRQVNTHVESPRPQVAKTACGTAAALVKNTNYTRKPDFYETVTMLLVKTGSYSRVVRRAANLALDHIVCGVEMTHAVTALCIHGVGHKNGLVRCAAARLLVVCCALAGGGRALLRTRPASAATARRHVLQALAVLLDDKNTETRKYAERLYAMLRPLSNFEAYYLTDVDVELASRQMKKYDQVLLPKETR